MAVSSKRTLSDLGLGPICSAAKRRSFNLGESSGTTLKLTRGNENVAVTAAAAATAASTPYIPTSSRNSSGNEDIVAPCRVSEVRKKLNKDLLLAVSRCSDSDMGSGTDWENVMEVNDSRKKSVSSRPSSFSSKRNQTPKVDLMARERCFDYIVQSIDEVWARYCDTTSNAEAVVYGGASRRNRNARNSNGASSSSYTHLQHDNSIRVSANTVSSSDLGSEIDEDFINEGFNCDYHDGNNTSNYAGGARDINSTDYDTDHSESRTVSNLPDSVKLQSLKSRLTRAKDDLEQVYDSAEYADCCAFWQRWDMAKYSAVEMMEEDDDDELIEDVIEELEQGRCYAD